MAALPHAVAPSTALADIRTVADCDATLDALTTFIVQAERRLSTMARRSPNEPADWRAGLTAELRIARMTLPRLQERRADLKREERQKLHRDVQAGEVMTLAGKKRRILVGIAWEHEPEAMRRVETLARELHPHLFDGGEAA